MLGMLKCLQNCQHLFYQVLSCWSLSSTIHQHGDCPTAVNQQACPTATTFFVSNVCNSPQGAQYMAASLLHFWRKGWSDTLVQHYPKDVHASTTKSLSSLKLLALRLFHKSPNRSLSESRLAWKHQTNQAEANAKIRLPVCFYLLLFLRNKAHLVWRPSWTQRQVRKIHIVSLPQTCADWVNVREEVDKTKQWEKEAQGSLEENLT